MIYITGDTHGHWNFEKLQRFASEQPALTRDDFVIIAGDFGAIWCEKTLERDLAPYEALPFTVLFVDGNHENFDLLDAYPTEHWQGGSIHRVRPNIFHLMRGQVFDLEGKTFFTFGGGTSIDKYMRREGESWWRREIPEFFEFDEAVRNLKRHDHRVNYIVTHSCDERALYSPLLSGVSKSMIVYRDNALLSEFEATVHYDHWYFGHYHLDGSVSERKTAVFEEILQVPTC